MGPISKYFHYHSASGKLVPHNNGEYWVLKNVQSNEIRQGHGTGLMQLVATYADLNKLEVRLVALPYGRKDGLDIPGLLEFYGRFGFVVVHARPPIVMKRFPSQFA